MKKIDLYQCNLLFEQEGAWLHPFEEPMPWKWSNMKHHLTYLMCLYSFLKEREIKHLLFL